MSEAARKPAKLADGKQQGLSQWDLMYIKFRRHRLAMFSGVFLIFVYIVILFAEFFSPYPTNEKFGKFVHTPPMPILFWDESTACRAPSFMATSKSLISRHSNGHTWQTRPRNTI